MMDSIQWQNLVMGKYKLLVSSEINVEDDWNKIHTIVNQYDSTLVWQEMAILSKICYRYKSQLRRDKHYQYLKKVERLTKRLYNLRMKSTLNNFLTCITRFKKRLYKRLCIRYGKISNLITIFFNVFFGFSTVIRSLTKIRHICSQLSMGLFIQFNLLAAAIVSRLRNCLTELIDITIQAYKTIYEWLRMSVKAQNKVLDVANFPADLSQYLQNDASSGQYLIDSSAMDETLKNSTDNIDLGEPVDFVKIERLCSTESDKALMDSNKNLTDDNRNRKSTSNKLDDNIPKRQFTRQGEGSHSPVSQNENSSATEKKSTPLLSAKLMSMASKSSHLIQQLECENERITMLRYSHKKYNMDTTPKNCKDFTTIIPPEEARLLYEMLKAKSFTTIFQGPKNLLLHHHFRNFSSVAFIRNYSYRCKILRHLKRNCKSGRTKDYHLEFPWDTQSYCQFDSDGASINQIKKEIPRDNLNFKPQNHDSDIVKTNVNNPFVLSSSSETEKMRNSELSEIDQIFAFIE
ncbi:uncharacterized protein TRIADDRAFT_62052 [Trichoplax adhaerens]|uniref:Nucleolus and neural progenitor protein-like N-terminal domain-containing protein n=1 Tax=Trichoplax adhaerens TaxID=10228 RepID=B3SCP7_TRIAD|nr:predicted protein [Trichoplax adhaerens]EDV19510.1 predicted protein [Trichoplax adhaerens]|eukprot:XP_002118027.1 predicted protein [Trichoplax adhaerens]